MKNFVILLLVLFSLHAAAGSVDTVSIYSNAMHKEIKCIVIKPNSYKKKKNHFPVVYLLHGHGGWYSNWIIRMPSLSNLADKYQLIIVCPDGHESSWYFDSPLDSTMKYETHVAKEVVEYTDRHFRTIPQKNKRAITGLSMGGHGAMFIALRHQDIFGAAGSMSGGFDLSYSKNSWDIMKRIGDSVRYAQNWKDYSILYLIEKYPAPQLKIMFDCGVNDFFYKSNIDLHEKMLKMKIPHDFTQRPGGHTWEYWMNSIEYHLLYFRKFFDEKSNGD